MCVLNEKRCKKVGKVDNILIFCEMYLKIKIVIK